MQLYSSLDGERHHDPFLPPNGNSCPIGNLPVELLSRIFQLGTKDNIVDYNNQIIPKNSANETAGDVERTGDMMQLYSQSSSEARLPNSQAVPIVVSHVCQHWRRTAISAASLWTDISISPDTQPPYLRVETFLQRSKCLPIDIRVRLGSHENQSYLRLEATSSCMADADLLFSLLVAHAHRWRTVDLRAVSHQLLFAAGAGHGDEAFRSLIMANNFIPCGGSTPSLESITLARVPVDWSADWISHVSRLTTLELLEHREEMSPSWDEITAILRGAPVLERLVLHATGPPGDPPNWLPDPELPTGGVVVVDPNPIQLLRLKHLTLSCQARVCVYGLLCMLYLPALKSLSVDFLWDDYTEFLAYITAPATVPAALSAAEPPRSLLTQLETFDINCSFCGLEVIAKLYNELENVTWLKVSMDDFWYDSAGRVPIQPLLPVLLVDDDDGDERVFVYTRLPRLETLSISDVSTISHFRAIRDVVKMRSDFRLPLKSVYVKSTYELDEENATWFRENLDIFRVSDVGCKPANR